ncbi:hypothetical protein B0H11DRAFT_2220465 [Mycena galericulata]|nr:hypothetical protein B0H11DRAFT_2220465 [Mycena galericulata]
MPDRYLAELWSKYTISPKPSSHMQSLQQTCLMFTEHFLEPSHIILMGGGFVLHPDLAEPLSSIVHAMDRLVRLAAHHHGLHDSPFIGDTELHILTKTTSLHVPATQNQVVVAWITLMDHLAVAMRELKALCHGDPFDPSRRMWPSRIPAAIMMLALSLRYKLPKELLASHDIHIPSPSKVDTSRAHPENATARGALRFMVDYTPSGRAVLVAVNASPPCVTRSVDARRAPEPVADTRDVESEKKRGSAAEFRIHQDFKSLTSASSSSESCHTAGKSHVPSHVLLNSRDRPPSVKALVAAIEAKERMSNPIIGNETRSGRVQATSHAPAVLVPTDCSVFSNIGSGLVRVASAGRRAPKLSLNAIHFNSVDIGKNVEKRHVLLKPENCLSSPALVEEVLVELGGPKRAAPVLDQRRSHLRTKPLTGDMAVNPHSSTLAARTDTAPALVFDGTAVDFVDGAAHALPLAPALVAAGTAVESGRLEGSFCLSAELKNSKDETLLTMEIPPKSRRIDSAFRSAAQEGHSLQSLDVIRCANQLVCRYGYPASDNELMEDSTCTEYPARRSSSAEEGLSHCQEQPGFAHPVIDAQSETSAGSLCPSAKLTNSKDESILTMETASRLSRGANASGPSLSSSRKDARLETRGTPLSLESPAPALVVDEIAVELGGLKNAATMTDQQREGPHTAESRTLNAASTTRVRPPPSTHISILALASPSCSPQSVAHSVTGIMTFALVSTIVRTHRNTYFVGILREELAPYIAWEREGIGTRCCFRYLGAGARIRR